MYHLTRKSLAVISLMLMTAVIGGPASAAEGERHLSFELDAAAAELIRLRVPAGEMEVVGITGDKVIAEATAVCEKAAQNACQTLLNTMEWTQKSGSITELSLSPVGVSEYNDVKIKVKIGVPSAKYLEVNLGAGDLRISDTSACLIAELNAGQITISLAQSQLASASLSAMVGDAKLVYTNGETLSGKRSALVGAKLEWDSGSGPCHTQAKVMAGEVKLTLK